MVLFDHQKYPLIFVGSPLAAETKEFSMIFLGAAKNSQVIDLSCPDLALPFLLSLKLILPSSATAFFYRRHRLLTPACAAASWPPHAAARTRPAPTPPAAAQSDSFHQHRHPCPARPDTTRLAPDAGFLHHAPPTPSTIWILVCFFLSLLEYHWIVPNGWVGLAASGPIWPTQQWCLAYISNAPAIRLIT
jgi:hypothetical protein